MSFRGFDNLSRGKAWPGSKLTYHRYKVCVLNFYLNNFVFPQHAKAVQQETISIRV
jgi:hypothetical protein